MTGAIGRDVRVMGIAVEVKELEEVVGFGKVSFSLIFGHWHPCLGRYPGMIYSGTGRLERLIPEGWRGQYGRVGEVSIGGLERSVLDSRRGRYWIVGEVDTGGLKRSVPEGWRGRYWIVGEVGARGLTWSIPEGRIVRYRRVGAVGIGYLERSVFPEWQESRFFFPLFGLSEAPESFLPCRSRSLVPEGSKGQCRWDMYIYEYHDDRGVCLGNYKL